MIEVMEIFSAMAIPTPKETLTQRGFVEGELIIMNGDLGSGLFVLEHTEFQDAGEGFQDEVLVSGGIHLIIRFKEFIAEYEPTVCHL
jgi:hypothetical protein